MYTNITPRGVNLYIIIKYGASHFYRSFLLRMSPFTLLCEGQTFSLEFSQIHLRYATILFFIYHDQSIYFNSFFLLLTVSLINQWKLRILFHGYPVLLVYVRPKWNWTLWEDMSGLCYIEPTSHLLCVFGFWTCSQILWRIVPLLYWIYKIY